MKIFKNKKEKNIQNEIEILDLNADNNKTEEEKKDFRFLLIILVIIVLLLILLPKITALIDKKSIFSYGEEVEEITNTKTIDGMLEIDKDEGNITVKKIKFYNPTKKTNNEISLTYLPETRIKDVNSLNIYIEFYNSNKTVIYRTKFKSDKTLERKVQGNYNLNVNELIYKEAKYAKITLIKDEDLNNIKENLICTKSFKDEDYQVTYKTIYNLSNNGLLSYQITKKAIKIENPSIIDLDKKNKYEEMFKKEAEDISKTNIDDLIFDDETIEYTVNLKQLDLGKSDYHISYELGATKRQIKLEEEKDSWSCE